MRRYHGYIADSARWERFERRPGDVVITTPAKCGTTWMQTIVGMLLVDRVELGTPMGLVSPWLDMLTRPEPELAALLAAQTHRRFLKTHTPLDGLPEDPEVTYLAVVRHPLDAALSNKDHAANQLDDRTHELRLAASGEDGATSPTTVRPEDPAEYLRWWIHTAEPAPAGTGINSLADFANSVGTYWERRRQPNVALFHYADLERDRDREMRRVAAVLGVAVDEARWPALVEAAGLDAMRARAADLVPDAHLGLWESTEGFFRSGGRRQWRELLDAEEITQFESRFASLVGTEAARWAMEGAAADG